MTKRQIECVRKILIEQSDSRSVISATELAKKILKELNAGRTTKR